MNTSEGYECVWILLKGLNAYEYIPKGYFIYSNKKSIKKAAEELLKGNIPESPS
jgi:hypothetical protein